MKNIKEESLTWVNLGLFFGIWILILYVSKTNFKINAESLSKLPDVVTVYAVLVVLFRNWLWKLRIFKGWLVPLPILHGTWKGQLKSTYSDLERGIDHPTVDVILVIKQTFDSITCQMFTKESESFSLTGQINEDNHSGGMRLAYNYTNRSKAELRDKSPMHDGAAILRIVESDFPYLEGIYWTSRKTTGDMRLTFLSRELVNSFDQGMNI